MVAWINGPKVALNYRYDQYGSLTNLWSSTPGVVASNATVAAYGYDLAGNLQAMRYA